MRRPRGAEVEAIGSSLRLPPRTEADMKKLRVIQWYTGVIAKHQIRLVHSHPSMELVGGYVHHAE